MQHTETICYYLNFVKAHGSQKYKPEPHHFKYWKFEDELHFVFHCHLYEVLSEQADLLQFCRNKPLIH